MPEKLSEQEVRLKKLKAIRQVGINPYPEKFDKQIDLAAAKKLKEGTKVKSAGRIMTIRTMGKIAFCHLQDFSGKMQAVLKEDKISADRFKFFVDYIDIGDFIGVEGEIFTTKKGEVSILVKKYELLGKAVRPLPEKWHGLQDTEIKYRQRYLDLIANRDTIDRFVLRSNIIKVLREFYWQRGFIEVETPILGNTASGAIAKPFITHHNALDTDVYLRIAPEIYLKECIIGGFEKVFEVARCFRNEGMDPSHLQDFTMVEHYAAYWNYEDNIKFTEKMFNYFFDKLGLDKKLEIENRDGKKEKVDWTTPWPRVDFIEMIKKDTGIDITKFDDNKKLSAEIKKKKINIDGMDDMSLVGLVDNLYKKVSRPKIINPTILYHYPKYLQPLARVNDDDPNIVDQFQLVVNGWEIVKAYSELVDSIDQKERFEKQAEAKQKGDEEAHGKDDEYVEALEHGAPPISGWGMGVDRLVSLLTQQDNLRDVVLFPLMKPDKDK
ncbi:lysine--tRNA ligase [Candidatus Falkowbacteria bacterium]|nr:lysine--tRNA ligase [Candidatus Falkowbacteria bacterium]